MKRGASCRVACFWKFLPWFVTVLTVVSTAHAGDYRLHVTGGAARALGGHQAEELGWGGGVYGALEWAPHDSWGIQIEGGWLGLPDRAAPQDPTLAPLDGASGVQVGAGLRVRPWGTSERTLFSAAGLWLSCAGGASFTGGQTRPQIDAFVGYDLFFGSGRLALGPAAGWVHVFQPDDQVRPDDANIAVLGLHGTFDFAKRSSRASKVTPSSQPRDRDGDGIADDFDRCPDAPEDVDGFEDEDGCPDLDNDGDGIPDTEDKCPNQPEDIDGFEDADGCPELDNDGDGIPDAQDKCPSEAEDIDGFEDADGCPDRDNDGDGIPDQDDLCPNEPETVNDYADEDGCPDELQVRVVGDHIVLDDKIRFWTNSHVIRAISYPVLDKLARLLRDHPEYVHISIEGHADQRGDEALNLSLSERRAQSVLEFLASRGVPRSRLSSKGFGSSKPISEDNTEYGWFLNRRVEFIVTRERKEVTASPGGPAKPPASQPETDGGKDL